jgi:PAS domain S-box-containing protein
MSSDVTTVDLQHRLAEAEAALASARAREVALETSARRYFSFFQKTGQGYCELELLRDADGRAIDQRYLVLNPAFERLFGIPFADAIGRTASELFPDLEPWWHEALGRIAQARNPERIEHEFAAIHRWFEVFVYPYDRDRLAVTFEDVTERRRAQDRLQESERRQRFLLELSDAIRPLSDPIDIQAAITRAIGEFAHAHWAYYIEIDERLDTAIVRKDYTSGAVPSMVGEHALGDLDGLVELIRSGQTFSGDIATMPVVSQRAREQYLGIGLRSFICAPVIKDGRVIAALNVADTIERDWQPLATVLEEVAERTWQAVAQAQAEAALRQSELRFRAIVERTRDYAIFTTDAEGRIDNWPAGAEAVFGWTPEEAIGQMVDMTFTPQDRANGEPVKERKTATAEGSARNVRWHLRKDGSQVFIEGSVRPLNGAGGPMVGFLKIGQDVTARLQSEERLRQSEARLKLALKVGNLATWDWDIPGDRVTWSEEHYRMEGYQVGEVTPSYEAWQQRVHPDDLLDTEAALAKAEASRSEYAHTFRSLHPDGTTVWLSARGRYFYQDDFGRAVRMIGVMEDVTDAHLAEAALRESEERLRQFGQASSDVLWIWNAQSLEFEYLSPAFDAIFGVERALIRAQGVKQWAQFITPEDRPGALQAIRQVRAGSRVTHEFRILRQSDDQQRWIQNTVFPLLDETGRVQRLGGIGQDVTELKSAADRMQVLVEELQHRTRNLIAVISSIARQTADAADGLPAFLSAFNDRLSALSRVQGLLSRKESEPITMASLVDMELGALGAQTSHQVRVQGPQILIRASAVQTLSLALHELATNAKKYGALAGGVGHLAVAWELLGGADHRVRLTWHEEGIHGPLPNETVKYGYGRVLVEQALPYSLGARTSYELTGSALRCTIELPLQETEGP